MLAGNTRDEGKLFPTLSAAGGWHRQGALARTTRRCSRLAFNYKPNGPPTTTIEQWIPPSYLPIDRRRSPASTRGPTSSAGVSSSTSRDTVLTAAADAAEQHLVLPLRLGRAARAVQRHLRRGACIRLAVCVRQLRPLAVRQHRVHDRQPARSAGVVGRDDAQHRRLRAQRRSEQRRARRHVAHVARDAGVRCDADRESHLATAVTLVPAPGSAPTESRATVPQDAPRNTSACEFERLDQRVGRRPHGGRILRHPGGTI